MTGMSARVKPAKSMNEQYYKYHGVNPDSIIDLRPKPVRPKRVWRDLIALRVIIFIGRVLIRGFLLGIDSLFRFVRWGYFNNRAELKVVADVPERISEGLKEEAEVFELVSGKKHSPLFKLANFFLMLCLLASPFLLYSAWRSLGPLRESITTSTQSAFAGLFSGKELIEQENFSGAEQAFEKAGDDFLRAQNDLAVINRGLLDLAGLVPDDKAKLAAESRHILAAGKLSARLGAELAAAITPTANQNVMAFLDRFAAHAIPAAEEARAMIRELKKINEENLPEQYRQQFIELRERAQWLAPSLEESVDLSKRASIFLGKQNDKRYLLVFQNNAERRGSGGFLGSFATVDVSRGEITELKVPAGGSYDTEAGLYRRVVAPEPLWLLNPLWHFWDANWWPDWPTTAKKLQWFYEKSDGPTVDGVISFTPTVIERLLAVHGAVDMTADYGVIITAENFWEVTQTFSEQKPDVTKEPKKIIGDLMEKLMADIPKDMTPQKAFALIGVFESSLREKHILLYFNDPILEASVKEFGWDGSVKATDGDYLMVASSNIGGQKSDRYIQETIDHQANVLPDGSITVTLRIQRAHTAPKNQQFVGFRNVNWLRVYVPEGSSLISASGFRTPDQFYFESPEADWELDPDLANERSALTDAGSGTKIYSENGKTVFANWSMVDPGETAVIEFRYRLPFKLKSPEPVDNWLGRLKAYFDIETSDRYSLLVQKQPGALNTTLVSSLNLSEAWSPLWTYPENLEVSESGWSFKQPLTTDNFLKVLFYKKEK